LYIEYECYAVGCDIDRTPQLFDQVPDARRHTIRADCARPETISYMQRNGYPRMQSVEKWSGSVEDGIAFMRSFEQIVVHPRCTHAAEEMRLYSYKVDRLTGDIRPEPIDQHNHIIDAIRYALTPMIRRPTSNFLLFAQQQMEAMNARKASGAA
jgi:phage terminase large subunit